MPVTNVHEVRRRVARDELMVLKVPESEREQRAYLERLAAWQKDIACLREEIVGLEGELNEAVYEVYGLNDGARRVVEGFLERF